MHNQFNEETIVINDGTPNRAKYFLLKVGPDARKVKETTLVIFVHGFPEISLAWRHQLEFLKSHNDYSCIAPDMRGYGRTVSNRVDVEQYAFDVVCLDLIALMKTFKREKAVFIGHDIGGAIVWHVGCNYPEVVLGIGAINTPLFTYVSPMKELINQAKGPVSALIPLDPNHCGQLDYQAYFCQYPNESRKELEQDIRRTLLSYFRSQIDSDNEKNVNNMKQGMRCAKTRIIDEKTKKPRGILYYAPKTIVRDPLWSEEEISIYVENYKRTGFESLNYYRNFDRNYQLINHDAVLNFPCMYVAAKKDLVLTEEDSKNMEARIPNLFRVSFNCGVVL